MADIRTETITGGRPGGGAHRFHEAMDAESRLTFMHIDDELGYLRPQPVHGALDQARAGKAKHRLFLAHAPRLAAGQNGPGDPGGLAHAAPAL